MMAKLLCNLAKTALLAIQENLWDVLWRNSAGYIFESVAFATVHQQICNGPGS